MNKYTPTSDTLNYEIKRGNLAKEWGKGLNEQDKIRLLAATANEQAKTNELLRKQAAAEAEHNEQLQEKIAEQTALIQEHQTRQTEEKDRAAHWRRMVAAIEDEVTEIRNQADGNLKTIEVAILHHRLEKLVTFENSEIALGEIIIAKDLYKSLRNIENEHLKVIGESRSAAVCADQLVQSEVEKFRPFCKAFLAFDAKAQDISLRLSDKIDEDAYISLCSEWSSAIDEFVPLQKAAAAHTSEIRDVLPSLIRWEIFFDKSTSNRDSIRGMLDTLWFDEKANDARDKHISLIQHQVDTIDALLKKKNDLRQNYIKSCISCEVPDFLAIRKMLGNFHLFSNDPEVTALEAPILELVSAFNELEKCWGALVKYTHQVKPPRIIVGSATRIKTSNELTLLLARLKELQRTASTIRAAEFQMRLSQLCSSMVAQVDITANTWNKICSNINSIVVIKSLAPVAASYWLIILFGIPPSLNSTTGNAAVMLLHFAAMASLWFTSAKWIRNIKPMDITFDENFKVLSTLNNDVVKLFKGAMEPPILNAKN